MFPQVFQSLKLESLDCFTSKDISEAISEKKSPSMARFIIASNALQHGKAVFFTAMYQAMVADINSRVVHRMALGLIMAK